MKLLKGEPLMKISKYLCCISFFYILISILNSCVTKHENLNRDMLDGRSLKFWDYYHSVDYCKRIDIFDSINRFKFKIYNNDKLTIYEKQGILEQGKLFSKVPNNLYGYIFFDLEQRADTICCIEKAYNGDFAGTWWLNNEFPHSFENLDSLENLVMIWKTKSNCK